MNPPSAPTSMKGTTVPGSRVSNSVRQGQIAAKIVIASRMAVLSTVPWMVIARAPVRVEALGAFGAFGAFGSTATKPPNDFDEKAGFEVRNAVLAAMRRV